jgi:hypothetical protein
MSHRTRLAATDGPGLLARSAALAAAGCGLAHGVLLATAPAGWTAVVQAALTTACLPCALHLWWRPRAAAWAMHVAVALALAMLLAHPLVVTFGVPVHDHLAPRWPGTAMPLLAGLGLFLAAWRWWLGCDVAAQPSASSPIASPGRRVPQA